MTKKLPPGWASASIQELAEVNPPKSATDHDPNTLVTFVPMSSVAPEFAGVNTQLSRPLREFQSGYTQFREGDVIVAKITPCMENGKLAVIPHIDSTIAFGSTEFHVLRPRLSLRPRSPGTGTC